MNGYTDKAMEAARVIFSYLHLRDPEPGSADLIVGFGHFDPAVPRQCGRLYSAGRAARIIFTGFRGAGTADIEGSEAAYFKRVLTADHPGIPEESILLEEKSTNTGENIAFSMRLAGIPADRDRIILVASPYRQRRVHQTCLKHLPGTVFFNLPPDSSLEHEIRLFKAKNLDLVRLLPAELGRLTEYPAKGFIAPVEIPPAVRNARSVLERELGPAAGTAG